VEFLQHPAEAIPLGDGTVDTVVTTWTLCTIPDAVAALREIRRVLRPDSRLIFIEHGRSTDPGVVRWQDRLTPLWRKVSGGCHLNRPIDQLLAQGGFQVSEMERGYMAGPRIGAYLYRGIARPDGAGAGADKC
jgi:SAM-dependent methyltransferase